MFIIYLILIIVVGALYIYFKNKGYLDIFMRREEEGGHYSSVEAGYSLFN